MSIDTKKNERIVNQNTSFLNDVYRKAATGKRITKPSDDAAGLSIANSLATDKTLLKQGRRNLDLSESALNIADGSYSQISELSIRMAELATQASSSLLSNQQRESLNAEFQQLKEESQRITATTEFNGTKLLENNSLTVQAGNDGSSNSTISLNTANIDALTNSLSSYALTSQNTAQSALDGIKTFANTLSQSRGTSGSFANRLEFAKNLNSASEENLAAAQSRIEDYNYAEGMAEKSAGEIRLQASTSLAGQASRLNGQVALALLT
jgi:flagellin